jgi:predicted transposase YdaD
MAYDNVCKYLAERFPEQFARWLTGEVARLRLYRRYPHLSVRQVVKVLRTANAIDLRKTGSERVFQTSFRLERLSHEFDVVRLWECDLRAGADRQALLPFRVLSQVEDPAETLREVVSELESLADPSERRELAAATAVLAGLALDRGLIRQIMRSLDMRESVIYQEWRAEALREGLEEGRKEGRREGRREGLQLGLQQGLQQGLQHGEATLVLRLLRRKLGSLDPALENKIWALSTSQLEALGEALLDFSSSEELTAWLARQLETAGAPLSAHRARVGRNVSKMQ